MSLPMTFLKTMDETLQISVKYTPHNAVSTSRVTTYEDFGL